MLFVEHLERFDKLMCNAFNDSHLGLGLFLEVSQVEWHVLVLLLDLWAVKKDLLVKLWNLDWNQKAVVDAVMPSALII